MRIKRIKRLMGDWIEAVDLEVPHELTTSGLVIPRGKKDDEDPTAKDRLGYARVVKAGPGRLKDGTGEPVPMRVNVGDVVLYNMEMADQLYVEGRSTVFFREGAIVSPEVEVEESAADARVSELLKS